MSMESAEAQANQVTMEITRKSIEITGALTKSTWSEIRAMVSAALTEMRDRVPATGRRVSTRQLEELTRGQRDSVNLTDPRVARRVEAELQKYGVTYAVTREGGGHRIHIGAGNAAQLDQAMQRAEDALARSLDRRESVMQGAGRAKDSVKEAVSVLELRESATVLTRAAARRAGVSDERLEHMSKVRDALKERISVLPPRSQKVGEDAARTIHRGVKR